MVSVIVLAFMVGVLIGLLSGNDRYHNRGGW